MTSINPMAFSKSNPHINYGDVADFVHTTRDGRTHSSESVRGMKRYFRRMDRRAALEEINNQLQEVIEEEYDLLERLDEFGM